MTMTEATSRLATRIRTSLGVAHTRMQGVAHTRIQEERARAQAASERAKVAMERVYARIRDVLDVPSRSDLACLAAHLGELDRRLATVERRLDTVAQREDALLARAPGAEDAGANAAEPASGPSMAAALPKATKRPKAKATSTKATSAKTAKVPTAAKTAKAKNAAKVATRSGQSPKKVE